ncbi:MAG: DoxX protein [Flammeovirgaceae bacterium]|nr:DoxX protein [Flammeovirgaceae bacterium]MBE60734.1 DoxX protein [Flammeovirgaceae bacterium]HCX20486.1 DoxX protein [Cytophagales bacterium]|tara:strand:- start:6729 stop:7166 length:438 start_codon:yes stop_codon:yes gene_type:complete
MNKRSLRIFVFLIRIALGLLFVYGGVQKFIPKPPRSKTEAAAELPGHVVKIKEYIGGMKGTGYFWPVLGVTEIVCGLLLLSQVFALLGAVMLVPVTLHIFLFHLFLEPHERGELLLTALYLLANIGLIAYEFPKLKPVFLNLKTT